MPGWWSDKLTERYWVEIRWVEGIGTELRCPQTDSSGRANAWYDLVLDVEPGDIVYHWSAVEHRFVGRSTAISKAAIANTGERVVPLINFTPIRTPVTLETLRASENTLIRIRDELRATHGSSTLFLPFQYRTDGIRMMSNYFAKLPAAVVDLLFGHTGIAEDGAQAPDDVDGDTDPPAIHFPGGFLNPFRPKADTEYVSRVQGSVQRRGRRHETLVNHFAEWLEGAGWKPGRNAAIDIGMEFPSVVIEAKVLKPNPAGDIRTAVGQLYEYRYFQVVNPESSLILLLDRSPGEDWVTYLETDRRIGVVWSDKEDWVLSPLAAAVLGETSHT